MPQDEEAAVLRESVCCLQVAHPGCCAALKGQVQHRGFSHYRGSRVTFFLAAEFQSQDICLECEKNGLVRTFFLKVAVPASLFFLGWWPEILLVILPVFCRWRSANPERLWIGKPV